jgi:hypothetical protein
MLGRHPLGVHDLILPAGIVAASTGHFYVSLLMLFLWGWFNKRRAIRWREEQDRTRV